MYLYVYIRYHRKIFQWVNITIANCNMHVENKHWWPDGMGNSSKTCSKDELLYVSRVTGFKQYFNQFHLPRDYIDFHIYIIYVLVSQMRKISTVSRVQSYFVRDLKLEIIPLGPSVRVCRIYHLPSKQVTTYWPHSRNVL